MSLERKIDELNKNLSDLRNELKIKYPSTLPEEFKENLCFSKEHTQGKCKPENYYFSNITQKKWCSNGQTSGTFPHLRHTFDPQGNYIVDMLEEVLENLHEMKKGKTAIIPADDKDQMILDLTKKVQFLEEKKTEVHIEKPISF